MWCYWEHLGGHIGNLMGAASEFNGNTLGAYKNPSLPENSKEKKLGLHECYHEHENYKEGCQNKSFKFKSKT
jgi:hypothetical protein